MALFNNTSRNLFLPGVDQALQQLEDDPQLFNRQRDQRYSTSPPPYSSGETTQPASPARGVESKKDRQIRQAVELLNSLPRHQFLNQIQKERKRILHQLEEGRLGLRQTVTLPYDQNLDYDTNAEDNVRNRWIEQGIWNSDWGQWPGYPKIMHGPWPFPGWGHEIRPSKKAVQSPDQGHGLFAGHDTGSSNQQPAVDEEVETVAKEDTSASRPYHQFLYQIAKEVEWLKDQLRTTGSRDIGRMKIKAYETIKEEWISSKIWNPIWGELPGMTWMHEDETPGEPEAAVTAAASALAEPNSTSRGRVEGHASLLFGSFAERSAEPTAETQTKAVSTSTSPRLDDAVRNEDDGLESRQRERRDAANHVQTQSGSRSSNPAETSALSSHHTKNAPSADAGISTQVSTGPRSNRRAEVASTRPSSSPFLSPTMGQDAPVLRKVRSARVEKPAKPRMRATRVHRQSRASDLITTLEKPRRSARLSELRNKAEPVTQRGPKPSASRNNQRHDSRTLTKVEQPKVARRSTRNAKADAVDKVTTGRVAKKPRKTRYHRDEQQKCENNDTVVARVVGARKRTPRTPRPARGESEDVGHSRTLRVRKAPAKSRRR